MPNSVNASAPTAPIHDGRRHGSQYFSQLRRRLRWQLLVAYVTPLLFLSVFFHYHYDRTLGQGVETHLKSVAENKRNTVSLFLQERVANVRSAFHFETLPRPPASSEMKGALRALRSESSTFVDVGLFNPQGILVSYAGPYSHLLRKDYSREDWYQRLLEQHRSFYISDVYLGFRGREHFIIAVRKELDEQVWTLRASVDPKRFSDFVGQSIMMEQVQAFIVNPKGQLQTLSAGRDLGRPIAQVPDTEADTQLQEMTLNRVRYLVAYAWIPENNWALAVRMPTDIAYAPLRRARRILAGISVLTLLLLVLFVFRRTHAIVKRLERTDAAKEEMRGQLFNAAKLASVGEMAAGVAHEINNPLAIIYEEAGFLKDTMDPQFGQQLDAKQLEESLDAIMEAALRGRAITSKLLAFARQHDGTPELTDVNHLIEKVLAIKQHEFSVSNIEVDKDFSEQLPEVLVNRNQMEQVLLNLLNNARDAINGSGRITFRTRTSGSHVTIDVQDTGCGMTPEQMARIFFPFFTTKGVGKGTGLGLSISHGIVEAAGGRLEVASALGVGSTFSVILPVAKAVSRNGGNDEARHSRDGNTSQEGIGHEGVMPITDRGEVA